MKEIISENDQLHTMNKELEKKNRQLRADYKELENSSRDLEGSCRRKGFKIEDLNTELHECKHTMVQATKKIDDLVASKRKLCREKLFLQKTAKKQKNKNSALHHYNLKIKSLIQSALHQADLEEPTGAKHISNACQCSQVKRPRSSPAEISEQVEDSSYSDEDGSNSCENITEVAPIACDQPVELVTQAVSAPPVTGSTIPISESSNIQDKPKEP